MKMYLHTGTNMDTPRHREFDSRSDDVKLEDICGEVVVIKYLE